MEVIVVGVFFLFSVYVFYRAYHMLKAAHAFEGLISKEKTNEE
mgnify:CR=1 FL=1